MNFKNEKERYLSMNIEDKRKLYKCGKNFVQLSDIENWNVGSQQINYRQCKDKKYSIKSEINEKVSMFTGDITTLEIDAIVNAANNRLSGGGGVDGAIHFSAGRDLLQSECRTMGGCKTGYCKITGGYKLPAKFIFHTVGPVGEKPDLLRNCYQRILELMEKSGLKTIAFPCISTGFFGYPNENAAHVSLTEVRKWFESSQYSRNVDRIIFCVFHDNDKKIYKKLMFEYFPVEEKNYDGKKLISKQKV